MPLTGLSWQSNMGLRIKSLNELGKGSWAISEPLFDNASVKKIKEPTAKGLKATMSPPQAKLWVLVKLAWPNLATSEYKDSIPNRKFTLDIAFVDIKAACEVDGWNFHGRFKAGFHRDREKDKLLMLNGWKTIRFTAKEINADGIGCLRIIEQIIGIKSAITLT